MLLCVVGWILGKAQNSERDAGRPDLVTNVIQTLESPVSTVSGAVGRSASDFLHGLFNARRLAVENRRLQDRLAAAALYTETAERLRRDLDSLRGQIQLPPLPGRTRVNADVVAYMPRDNRMTITAGERQGILVGMPVVGPAGLVGTVQTVAANRSQVLLLTSRAVTIGAIVMNRNPSPAGLLRGANTTSLELAFTDPKAPVQIGDIIASSGLSELIPRGIPIGRVIQVEENEAFGERRAVVDPFVSPGELKEVAVLR